LRQPSYRIPSVEAKFDKAKCNIMGTQQRKKTHDEFPCTFDHPDAAHNVSSDGVPVSLHAKKGREVALAHRDFKGKVVLLKSKHSKWVVPLEGFFIPPLAPPIDVTSPVSDVRNIRIGHFNYEPSDGASEPNSVFKNEFACLNEHETILTRGQSDDKLWYPMRVCCILSTAAVSIIRAANTLKHPPMSEMFKALTFLTSELGIRGTLADDSSSANALTIALDMWRAKRLNQRQHISIRFPQQRELPQSYLHHFLAVIFFCIVIESSLSKYYHV
jgi:hypothetical protein